jgi:succinyl-diaminopimelate desuccinylase
MPSWRDDPGKFADKYLLAREAALKELPDRGTCGQELEWNLLDAEMRPLQTVGAGPAIRSFIDVLRADFLPEWLAERNQLEVFHWMTEWATRPYYSPQGAVYEARLLEASLLNALAKAGRRFSQRLYAMHGNLLYEIHVDHTTIPHGWNIAKRRYLERCVDLYGGALATSGNHANLSLPEQLLAWDFLHLSATERGEAHLDDYKNATYVAGARVLRAYASLFIATAANTPLRPELRQGKQVVALTGVDSLRNLTFPYPERIDPPGLYRSHPDYLRLSYELVRQGIRFGNNNWTPTRARSFAEPVERLIATTGEELHTIFQNGLYGSQDSADLDRLAHEIEIQNLLTRIDIPMARVEIRTDDGGAPMEVDIANLAFKELLLIASYADPAMGESFTYDAKDLARARRNEAAAARRGLEATIEHPFASARVPLRRFLRQTLEDIRPLAEALGRWPLLEPLSQMADGAPNPASVLRQRIRREIGDESIVPVDLLRQFAEEREALVAEEVSQLAADLKKLNGDIPKLQGLLWRARDEARRDPQVPIRFRASLDGIFSGEHADKTAEIVELAQALVRIPSVSNAPPARQRLLDIHRAATFIYDYLKQSGLEVQMFEGEGYPAVLAGFPGGLAQPVMLSGHFDVVEPDPDDGQFEPRLEGDYLLGRGAADMKTVVASYLVWMKDTFRKGGVFPPINLLLVGNEEIGEAEPAGTPYVLDVLKRASGYAPELLIAGERTGEGGSELFGEVCVENRGLMRFEIVAHGRRGHTGVRGAPAEMSARLFAAREDLSRRLAQMLTLGGGWASQMRFPFVQVGEPGIYNVTSDKGVLGLEIRPIPQDDAKSIVKHVEDYCAEAGLEVLTVASESGIVCDASNPWLVKLIQSIRHTSGNEPVLGRKLPGTSARFAPGGQGVVWGQSGIGPHSADERHFIPSIIGYYRVLLQFAHECVEAAGGPPQSAAHSMSASEDGPSIEKSNMN